LNTFAKAGRIALLHLFSKKEGIFGTTRYQELGMASKFPRKVTISTEPVNLERKYLSCVVNAYGRHNSYRIFLWSVELGLSEILLSRVDGKLLDLICRCSDGPLSHIVIATVHRDHNDDSSTESEEIIIYSLTDEQKRYISDTIYNAELDQYESEEDFTFSHGYFPEKGIVGGKR
jgi:hypothetical protein